ncbi:MAG TPA: selenocysteine-specific translation elongation factor [Kofleriaceae bacterium]
MLVLGTAGHIDHGKTALVRALTGIDTDRLPVEKARGITTELGFAWLDLGGRRLAVVDVPGHERFVKSMVAGATGIDAVLLVIAADEGVMPQTREHLAICDLLGVRRAIVALTKSDLVDADGLELATMDVREALAGTTIESAPIVPVSAKSGAGLDDLRAQIAALADALPARAQSGPFRLPIDRVFSVKGHGTVVTGTILGGSVGVGDELEVVGPRGVSARVRGLEVHGAAIERAVAGQRAAINLGGVAVDDLARGDLLASPGQVAGSHILDVELKLLPSAAPLGARTKVLVHHATQQVLATLALVPPQKTLAPGATGLAQIRVPRATPLGALPGDRVIVRGFVATRTHGTTIAGGTVLRVLAPKARNKTDHAAAVAAFAAAKLQERIAIEMKTAGKTGRTSAQLVQRLGVSPDELGPVLTTLLKRGEIEKSSADANAIYTLPAAPPPKAVAAPSETDPVQLAILARLAEGRLEPLRPKELGPALKLTEAHVMAALAKLVAAKQVVRIKPDLMMDAGVVAETKVKLLAFLAEHTTIDAQGWKTLTGASRKFTIPLAEYFDAEKVTLRVGDIRRKR